MLEIDRETFVAMLVAREDRAVALNEAALGEKLTPFREKRIRTAQRKQEKSMWSGDSIQRWPDGRKMLDLRHHAELLDYECYGGLGFAQHLEDVEAARLSVGEANALRHYLKDDEEEDINIILEGDSPDPTVRTRLRDWRVEMELHQRKKGTNYRSCGLSLTPD